MPVTPADASDAKVTEANAMATATASNFARFIGSSSLPRIVQNSNCCSINKRGSDGIRLQAAVANSLGTAPLKGARCAEL